MSLSTPVCLQFGQTVLDILWALSHLIQPSIAEPKPLINSLSYFINWSVPILALFSLCCYIRDFSKKTDYFRWLLREEFQESGGESQMARTYLLSGLVAKSCRTFATPWTVAHQTPLSMGFLRQEYWSGLPFPSPADLPDPGIKPASPELPGNSSPPATWEALLTK